MNPFKFNSKDKNASKGKGKGKQKDIIFILIMGLILANLVYIFAGAVVVTITERSLPVIVWLFVDGVAIIGALYLLRSYRRSRRIEIQREAEEELKKEQEL